MKAKLKRSILIVLLACDGQPMPEAALVEAVRLNVRPSEPVEDDVVDALKDCRAEGYVQGVTDEFSQEHTWTLTDKGIHQARKLR
jgi:hypothetical protein